MAEEQPAALRDEAYLTLSRTSPQDNQLRQLFIKLDGETIGYLTYGNSNRRPIPAGRHKLVVNNTFVWKTIAFDAKAGEEVRFQLTNRNGRLTLFLLAVLGAGPMYISVERL